MKALRIYYDAIGKIVYHIGLEGSGEFPRTVTEELQKLPLGTKLLELADSQIDQYLTYEGNSVQDGQLVLGTPTKTPPPPEIKRDLIAEFDNLKQTLINKGLL